MRSPIVPLLLGLNLLTLVLLAFLVMQSVAIRSELDQLHREVAAAENGIGSGELALALGDLENRIKELLQASGAGSPLGPTASPGSQDARIGEILDILRRLESRLDQICQGVPVC